MYIKPLYIITELRGKVHSFLLSDIGEGMAEVQVKEWYVKQ